MKVPSFLVCSVLLAGFAPAAPPNVVELGGARKIRGEVTSSPEFHTVTVSFLAVRAFDGPTNDEVNRELGREYGLRVLASHLAPAAPEVRMDATREEIVEAKLVGERYTLVSRWPKDAVREASTVPLGGKPTGDGPTGRLVPTGAFSGKFFTAKQDHLDTLAAISSTTAKAAAKVRSAGGDEPDADRRRNLLRRVAAAEESGLAAFAALAQGVRADQHLLDLTERPELQKAIEEARKRFLATLRAVLEDPKATEKLPFANVKIEKPFDAYLTGNPLTMELAGAILVEAGDGQWYLIGVGKTVLKDGSPEEALRGERVCTLKARVAAVGEKDGARLSYLKRVEDRVVVVKDADGSEAATTVSERLKVTKEKIEGVARGLPVVGRWTSEDGKTLYVAVGGKLPASAVQKK